MTVTSRVKRIRSKIKDATAVNSHVGLASLGVKEATIKATETQSKTESF